MQNYLHTVSIYNKHVQAYVNKFMGLDLYKDTFDDLLEVLPANSMVLELGCGPGNVIKYLRSKRADLVLFGIDLAPEMIKEAIRQNPGAHFEVMDIGRIGQFNQKFSALVAAFCLPYISSGDVPDFFRNMRRLLSTNGILYLSLMEGPGQRSGFEKTSFTGNDEIYINYYERAQIDGLLQSNGFNIENFHTKDYPEPDGSITTDLIYIARKS